MHEEETNPGSKEVEPELKECPFCGVVPILEQSLDPRWIHIKHDEYCVMALNEFGRGRQQYVEYRFIDAWNRRVSADSAGAMVGRTLCSELIHIAAELARGEGFFSTCAEDMNPRLKRTDILKTAEDQERRLKDWAYRVRQVANKLMTAAAPPAPKEAEEAPMRREVKSSRHPHFTAADHERMKETLDSLSDYPTEEEAEAVLQACGTSGKEVVNEFIERLLKENSELKARLAAKPSGAAREAAEEIHNWMFSPPDSWPVRGEASIAQLVAIISRHFPAAAESVRQEEPHPGYDCGGTCVVHGGLASDCDPDG